VQFLISAFRLIVADEAGNPLLNTYWVTEVDFVIFMQNAIQFLAANLAASGRDSVRPGEPVTVAVPDGVEEVTVQRPQGASEKVPASGAARIHYGRTDLVGIYEVEPGIPGENHFAVNLFDPVESMVRPADEVVIGVETVQANKAEVQVNRPAWPYFLMALLAVLLLEWIIYNRRVFV
jgi:hypothetical protein